MSLVEVVTRAVVNDPQIQKAGHTVAGTFMVSSAVNGLWHILPTVAATLMWVAGFTWYAIQIYESKTYKDGVKTVSYTHLTLPTTPYV